MLALGGSLLVAAGLIVLDQLLLRSAAGSLIAGLFMTIGVTGVTGAAFAYLRMRRKGGVDPQPARLAWQAALLGVVVGCVQMSLRFSGFDIVFGPGTGFMCGGFGALIAYAAVRGVRTRTDVGRGRRFLRALKRSSERWRG